MKRKSPEPDDSPQFVADVVLDTAAQLAVNVRETTSAAEMTANILESLGIALTKDAYSPDAKRHIRDMMNWPNALPTSAIARIFAPDSPDDKVPAVERWLTLLAVEQPTPAHITCTITSDVVEAVCVMADADNQPFFNVLWTRLFAIDGFEADLLAEYAAMTGNLRVFQRMKDEGVLATFSTDRKGKAMLAAVNFQQLNILNWMEHDLQFFPANLSVKSLRLAASNCDEDGMRWLRNKVYMYTTRNLDGIVEHLAFSNRLRSMQTFRRVFGHVIGNGCFVGFALNAGMRLGNLAMLQWPVTELGFVMTKTLLNQFFVSGAKKGFVNILTWIMGTYKEQFDHEPCIMSAFAGAGQHGSLLMLDWLKAQYDALALHGNAMEGFWQAARAGHVHVLQWYKDNFGNAMDPYDRQLNVTRHSWNKCTDEARQWIQENFPPPFL